MLKLKTIISGVILSLGLCQSVSAANIFGLKSNPKECKEVYKNVVCEIDILTLISELENNLPLSEYTKLIDPLMVDITIDTRNNKNIDLKRYPFGIYMGRQTESNCFYSVFKSSVTKDGNVSMVSDRDTRAVTLNLGPVMVISPIPLIPGKSKTVVFKGTIDICVNKSNRSDTWHIIHGLAANNAKIIKF